MRHFWLNFHVDYTCRHSGACCSAGWPIPVERDRVIPIQQASQREGWLVPAIGAPADVAGTLALRDNGHCVFHGDHGCDVYAARPSSCSHFPYVCLIDPRGVHVTLSHYCPTAASMLFDHDGRIAIVEGPAPIPGRDTPEGLDARESLPPLASPNRLMSFDSFSQWERDQIVRLRHLHDVDRHLFAEARRAVPMPLSWPDECSAPAPESHLAPLAGEFAPVVNRYLAARLFASWAAYHGDGIASVLQSVETARAVLRVEAERQVTLAGRALDRGLLTNAVRQSDLLLVHYADSRVLSSADPS